MMQDAVMQWRTYDCFIPHCRCAGDGELTIGLCLTGMTDLRLFFAIFYFFVGGSSEASHRASLLLLEFGPLGFCAWSLSTSATKVNFSLQ